MKTLSIAIIGGGASGIVAAITAARSGATVTIFEKADRIGKKILQTGNGRCNLSNARLNFGGYNRPDFAKSVIDRFSVEKTLSFFEDLGLLTVTDEEGRIYPRTQTATTVLNVLRRELERLKVGVVTSTEIGKIEKVGNGFSVCGKKFDKVIVSVGGRQSLLSSLGVKEREWTPSLVPVETDKPLLVNMNGAKLSARVKLLADGKCVFDERGEVLFRDYGLSGIVIFNASAYIARKSAEYKIEIDPFFDVEETELAKSIEKRTEKFGYENCFEGLINKFLASNLLKSLNIKTDGELKSRATEVAAKLKALTFTVLKTKDFSQAQVASGGVIPCEVTENLELKKLGGTFVCGEAVDVDGVCGGYNLQWAWSSGAIAGAEASKCF